MKTRIASLTAGSAFARNLLSILFAVSLPLLGGIPGAWASPPEPKGDCHAYDQGVIINGERTILHGNIAHYTYDVRIGPGEFDVIRVHRVVKERRTYCPVPTVDGVFMTTGAANSFEAVFLTPLVSSVLPWDHSAAAFFAKHNLDVWGLDFGWALVPAETTDFSFMQGWGLEREMHEIDVGLGIARRMRGFTGQGFGRLHLLGFARSACMTYTLAAEETQKPYWLRKIKGIIPVDWMIKTDDEAFRLDGCNSATSTQDRITAGTYHSNQGASLKLFADLAESAPDDQSPFVPATTVLTNRQFLLRALTTGTFWHFAGGDTEQLLFSDPQVWIDLCQAVPPYAPHQVGLDIARLRCGEVDVPFDDHLAEVTVPILYVGAAGGCGQRGIYSTTLTASMDVTVHIVQELGDDMRAIDYGHGDLILGEDADILVWKPILKWIKAHAPRGH